VATEVIRGVQARYREYWLAGMRAKIGLASEEAGDPDLIDELFAAMEGQGVDFTLFFRHLADAARGDDTPVRSLFANCAPFDRWLAKWQDRLSRDGRDAAERAAAMDAVNPLYIPRNHQVEAALAAAVEQNDLAPFKRLLAVVSDPFVERPGLSEYETPAPAGFYPYRTFCGT